MNRYAITLFLLTVLTAGAAHAQSIHATWTWDGKDTSGIPITDSVSYSGYVCKVSPNFNCETPPSQVAPPYPATDGWEANYPDPNDTNWNQAFFSSAGSPINFTVTPYNDNITVNPGDVVCTVVYMLDYRYVDDGAQYVFGFPSNIACKQF